ncbi:MAG TPA: hypothetical protein VFM74_08215 [Candidatus Limnocylindria bacterium]|nr:hypothetical protein [Candidatus Limnocylindria bacterium]
MRRSLPTALVVIVGLLLLVDFVVVNPSLAGLAGLLILWIVLLAAAAAVTGTIALAARHVTDLVHRRGDRVGSILVLVGIGLMFVAGFYPGSAGAADPAVRWLVGALLAPLIASIFALLFIFLLGAMRRGLRLRAREMTVMLAAAGVVLVLLLPLAGDAGRLLNASADWLLAVPIGGVFRGLLIGIAIGTAVMAARLLLAVDGSPDD